MRDKYDIRIRIKIYDVKDIEKIETNFKKWGSHINMIFPFSL